MSSKTFLWANVEGEPVMRLVAVLSAERAALIMAAVKEIAESRDGIGRQVVAWGIDAEVFARYRDEGGRTGRTALPVTRFQIFPSAMEASWHLGCRSNEVALALGNAKRNNQDEATVRGVTFRYAEDTGRVE